MKQSKSDINAVPKLIVFDLDNTCWTPELYQLRKLERNGQTPVADQDVKLFPGMQRIVKRIQAGEFPDTQFAVASRTKSVTWAHNLLTQFGLRQIFEYIEIFPGDKKKHFQNLQQSTGLRYEDMLFFDDARDGKYGNCVPVSSLGVLSVHTPDGLRDDAIFHQAMSHYKEWYTTHSKKPNSIVEWDGSLTIGLEQAKQSEVASGQQETGRVKTVNFDKQFGFIQCSGNKSDVFFHFNNLPNGVVLNKGDTVSFTVERNRKNGKLFAANISTGSKPSDTMTSSRNEDTVKLHCFSMNLPFAALLANGYKDLESRNGTMFVPYPEGTQMLLHVGQRIYPDGDKHLEIMRQYNTDDEIAELKSLPSGFRKGNIVAIMEIGATYETTEAERSTAEMQKRICAYGSDSGRIVTEIRRVAYLKRPVKMSGRGGVFKIDLPESALPDGWKLPDSKLSAGQNNQSIASADKGKPVYSISG